MRDLHQYPYEIRPLSDEEGGGFFISFPDFSECMADGETVDEAISNGLDALLETITALESMNLPVPEPRSAGVPVYEDWEPDEWQTFALGQFFDEDDVDDSIAEAEAQDEARWDALFDKTQSQLAVAAKKAEEEIKAGQSKSMDYDAL